LYECCILLGVTSWLSVENKKKILNFNCKITVVEISMREKTLYNLTLRIVQKHTCLLGLT